MSEETPRNKELKYEYFRRISLSHSALSFKEASINTVIFHFIYSPIFYIMFTF
jgi:hypothetical protein